MKQHDHTGPANVRQAPRATRLGEARKLTRASFIGNNVELVSDRLYSPGA